MKALLFNLIRPLYDWWKRRTDAKAKERLDVIAESRRRAHASRDSRQADLLDADRRLFGQLVENSELAEVVSFLDEHNFGDAYLRQHFVWIDNFIREWDQPTREFHGTELQERLEEFLAHLKALRLGLTRDTFVVGQSMSHSRVPAEWMTTQRDRFWSVVKELNQSAEDSVNAYNSLIRWGKSMLAV